MAEQLVASMTGEFNPADYEDGYRQALMEVIEKKVAGEEPEPQERAEPTNITDLMAALEASVSAAREDRKAPKAARRPRQRQAARPAKAPARAKGEGGRGAGRPRQRRRKTA